MDNDYSFRFLDDELNEKLVARIQSSAIPHQVDPDGTIRYSTEDEQRVDESVIRAIREEVFPRWQVLTCPPDAAPSYRRYMEHNRLPFEEEVIDGAVSFLIPLDVDPHRWKLGVEQGSRNR